MTLVSSSIPNLVNGVSQQPFTLRLASQGAIQENGLSTVSNGLKKRPPTQHIARLSDRIEGSAYIHEIVRDESERYTVIITNGDLKVYDLEGNEKVVNFPNGKSYLNSSDPSTSFRAVTVADYTFIVNKNVVVQPSSAVAPARAPEALVVVQNGLYSKTYSIIIDGVERAHYTTPDGTVADQAAQISTDYIATQLASQLTANGIQNGRVGSVIRIVGTSDFTIRCEDGYSNAALLCFKGEAQRFSLLPSNCGFPDFTIQVVGDSGTNADNYWVRFDMSTGVGVWRETVKPSEPLGFSADTMPKTLVRESNGTFTFRNADWAGRTVGDEESNPDPTFVGNTIRDVFFHRNRLGFLSDEAAILSESGGFFNFYRTTVITLLDSDPIDVSASHVKVSILNFAVPFNKDLLLFSAQTQFAMQSGDLLTPKTVSIKPTTEFECSTVAPPVGVGRNVYFAVPKGDHEGVREYYVATTTDTEDATDVTGHVPKYIPKGVYKIAPALNEDMLCLLTTAERNVIYVYKFYWDNNQKLLSSWSRWVMPAGDEILNAAFIESELFLVINRADGLYLEKLSISLGDIGEGEPFTVHLDRKQYIHGSELTLDGNKTRFSLGWNPTDGDYAAVVAVGQPKKAGILDPVMVDDVGPYIMGDFTGCDLIVGRKYLFHYRFSPVLIRTQSGQGQKADTVGRLQVGRMQVNYDETGYFQAKVTPHGRNTYTYTYTGKTLGVDSANLGAIGIESGSFSFKVNSRNTTVDIDLVSDSPLPCAFTSADWEGQYVRRSQAV
jgi:hypothetical protein